MVSDSDNNRSFWCSYNAITLHLETVTKTNDKRHLDNEKMIYELKDTTKVLSDLVIKIETRQEFQQKEIDQMSA